MAASQAAQKAEKLAKDNYKAGLVDFIEVLNAQKAVLTFQDNLAQSKGAVASNLISLYKALGGGWQNLWEEESFRKTGENYDPD